MPLPLNIDRLGRTDEDAFFRLRRKAILLGCSGSYTQAQLERWTDSRSDGHLPGSLPNIFCGARIEGQLIATGMIDIASGEVGAMFVLPEYGRRGIGRTMLRHLEGVARSSGLETIYLDATLNAVDFYRSQGFVGETRGLFHSPRGLSLECVPMTKSLQADSTTTAVP